LSSLDFLVEWPSGEKSQREIKKRTEQALEALTEEKGLGQFPVHVTYAVTSDWFFQLAKTTATSEHWKQLGEPLLQEVDSEEKLYESLGLPWISPEARETGEEVQLARASRLGSVLPWDGVMGVFHNHTSRSDGADSLEVMVEAASRLGYQYIGISDHSKTAFYAQGLSEETLLEQREEVARVQSRFPQIKIFWGIESDILADGSLDYDDRILKKFDFVIASVHSRFGMDREAMTDRIVKAIRHPSTRFIGHLTGRLLLGRKGFEVDMERILGEAVAHDVAIEINAHPSRLDLDWRYGSQLRKLGVKTSINPDAHEVAGLEDVRYGVVVARKALLPGSLVVNSWGTEQVEAWLKRKTPLS
jgi:DNA polymerase (family 10)